MSDQKLCENKTETVFEDQLDNQAIEEVFTKLRNDLQAVLHPAKGLADAVRIDAYGAASRSISFIDNLAELIRGVDDIHTQRELTFAVVGMVVNLTCAAPIISTAVKDREDHVRLMKGVANHSAGSKRGDQMKEQASKWQAAALKRAQELRSKNPSLTQHELAEKIEKWWADKPINAPAGREHLVKIISGWEKAGDLSKRTTR